MEAKGLDLKSLSMDELTGVIRLYPWFGAARAELCERMASLGGSDWGTEQYSDAALYVPCRTKIFSIMRSSSKKDYSDKDLQQLLKEWMAPSRNSSPEISEIAAPESGAVPASDAAHAVMDQTVASNQEEEGSFVRKMKFPEVPGYHRTVRPAGGDFFSKDEYESVKRDEDYIFSRFKADRSDDGNDRSWEDPELGFCTETLAQIYAEQGYFTEAKKIYSRLILRYPEKSAYFATLIGKLSQEN